MELDLVYKQVTQYWNDNIAFNKVVGFKITQMEPELAVVEFRWHDNIMGNPIQQILHGGVIAAALDMVGGAVSAANMISRMHKLDHDSVQRKLSRFSTIDLRTDFLRPGKGEHFIATAKIIRHGSKISVTRMELHNEKGEHIAFGTGTYIV